MDGEGIVGLQGYDGAGSGGQSVSVMTRAEETSCMGSVFGCSLVAVHVVRQW